MRILCIGDSNTWGYNPENGMRFRNRWTRLVAEAMPEHEIIEEGLNGRTLLGLDSLKNERWGLRDLKMILMTHKPVDLVVVMLGTNDLKREFNCCAELLGKGIKEYIKVILNPFQWEKYGVPKMLVMSPILLGESLVRSRGIFGEFDENSLLQAQYMAQEMEKACKEYQVPFLNAALYAEPSEIDGLHMDEANHQKLAAAICEKLKELE